MVKNCTYIYYGGVLIYHMQGCTYKGFRESVTTYRQHTNHLLFHCSQLQNTQNVACPLSNFT